MNSVILAGIVFGLVLGSAMLAGSARNWLPERHLSADSKDAARLSVALIATMVALVLSLLVASAKGGFDARRNHLVQLSANVVLLDRVLAHYGPEANGTRSMLQAALAATVERYWPIEGAPPTAVEPTASPVEALYDKIEALAPTSDPQRALRGQAMTVALDIGRTNLLLFGNLSSSIPVPFMVALVFWLCIIFASYGLFAPRNATVMSVLGLCALSASVAIFLILELDRSVGGLMQVSGDPLRAALAQLGR